MFLRARAYYLVTPPTIAVSVIVRGRLVVVPATFLTTTLLRVTVARRAAGLRARTPEGDSSIETVPATARQISGPTWSGLRGLTRLTRGRHVSVGDGKGLHRVDPDELITDDFEQMPAESPPA